LFELVTCLPYYLLTFLPLQMLLFHMIIYFLQLVIWFLRTFTPSSGTALPGLWLEKYFPGTAKKLLQKFDKVILVTGTNGKTTTTQMICHLLEQNNISYVTNKSGSNLVRGILSSVIQTRNQKLETGKPRIGVFEVEEGSMPKLTRLVKADAIVVTNIFRDQLDAYGEIDKTLKYIREAIEQSENPILLLNADDTRVASLANSSSGRKYGFHLDEKYLHQIKFEELEQSYVLRVAGYELVNILDIEVNEDLGSGFSYSLQGKSYKGRTKVPGLHNVLNAVYAQVLVKDLLGENAKVGLEEFEPAFGRGEIISVPQTPPTRSAGHPLFEKEGDVTLSLSKGTGGVRGLIQFQILLAKNPAGLNLNFHLLENTKKREAILLILNDKIADGRDISWIWDVDFSILKNLNFEKIFVAGTRRFDMALRLSYELRVTSYELEEVKSKKLKVKSNKKDLPEIFIYEDIESSVSDLISSDLEKVYVLPTYTAMREFRDELGKYTEVKRIYE
jgi:lipid II isoglutaminyl synthase (glutamine-hydrolysing)